MKKSLSHLPKEKKDELKLIVQYVLQEVPETEMIILYGSYTTKDKWVDYDQRTEYNVRTLFMSDYDLVVLTPKKQASHNSIMRRLNNAALKFSDGHHFTSITPIHFINEAVEDFNMKIDAGRYFYTDIKKTGILLFDKGNYKLARIRKQNFQEIRDLAEEYFEEKFHRANVFLKDAKNNLIDGEYRQASFYLHQSMENYLNAIILTSSLYAPKEHNLTNIMNDTKLFTNKAVEIFPDYLDIKKDRLFKLLEDAYVQARYNKEFKVTKEDIEELFPKFEQLKITTQTYCESKIQFYSDNIKNK